MLFAALCLLSLGVWSLQPPVKIDGKIRLVRVSDLNPLRQAQVDLFSKEHPGFKMELDPSSDLSKVIVQSLGGVGPDCFDSFDVNELSAYVRSGIAWDVTDELQKRGIDVRRDCYPGMVPSAEFEGRIYGVPTNIAADGIWFRRDALDAIGYSGHHGPWKWPEFIELAQKLTRRDSNGKPLQYGFIFEWWQWGDFLKGFDAPIYTPDGTRCVLDDPRAIQAVQLMHDLVYKYRVSSSPVEEASQATAGGFGSGSMSVLGSGHAAMALGGRWWLAQLRTYKGLNLGVMEAPYGTTRKTMAYGRATLINKASPNRQAALDYLVFQAGADYNNLVNRQADGISAFPKYNQTPEFLLNPDYPGEKDNAVWRDITEHAEAQAASPFVNGKKVSTIIQDQLDLVKADQKDAAAAMRDAAKQINLEIQKTLAENPSLADRYRQLTGGAR